MKIFMNIINADNTLDCRGLSCPMPLLKTYKTLAIMTSGEILELWGKGGFGRSSSRM